MQYSLTELQLAIMDALWRRGEASVYDVHDDLRAGRRVAQSTVATLLSRLEEKGVVSHRAENRQHIYRAVATREQVRRSVVSEFAEFTDQLFAGELAGLVNQLLTIRDADPEDLARAREIIERKERELRGRGGRGEQ